MKIKLTLLLFIFLYVNSFPQNDSLSFQNGVTLYELKNYRKALKNFENEINASPRSPHITAAILFKAKTLYALGDFSKAKTEVIDFLNNYPSSRYVDEARFLLSKIYLDEKDYNKAFHQLLVIIDSSDSVLYVTEAISSAEKLALNYLTVNDLRSHSSSFKNDYINQFLLFLTAQVQVNEQQFDAAISTLNELINKYPKSDFKDGAINLMDMITKGDTSSFNETNICVLLPLSGISNSDMLTASKEILEGIKFAIDEFNKEREDKIGLIIKDTENNEEKIKSLKSEIVNDPSIKVILGPVFSSEVEIALEEFKSTGIPVISPTATDNDLTLLNSDFFQANPNFIIRARAIAQYIYYVENKRRMAVLNSIDGYSPLLAAEFVKEFERLGGKIIAKYTYKSENLYSDVKIDSTELVNAEGLYIPLSDRADAPLIFSQLVKNRVNLPLYGNQDWFQAKGFETSPELSNKMIFTSDYFIEYNNSNYQEFNKKFLSKTRIDANRNVLYGYDSAKYILTVLRNINRDRRNIKLKMESGISVTGFHNNISFNDEHVNLFMNIVRYNEGYFELIDKFKVGK